MLRVALYALLPEKGGLIAPRNAPAAAASTGLLNVGAEVSNAAP